MVVPVGRLAGGENVRAQVVLQPAQVDLDHAKGVDATVTLHECALSLIDQMADRALMLAEALEQRRFGLKLRTAVSIGLGMSGEGKRFSVGSRDVDGHDWFSSKERRSRALRGRRRGVSLGNPTR